MDARTLSYINLYGILGTLPELCRLSPEAQAYLRGQTVRVGITVKNGPAATLSFDKGQCALEEGTHNCQILLPFSSPERFNGMIDGTVTPIPVKGLTRVGFLTGPFTKLTDLLTRYLRPQPGDLDNERFFEISTRLMFRLIVSAVAQIGNEDPVGRASASYIVDTDAYFSHMEFCDMHLARDLFDGKVNAVTCVGTSQVRLSGMISQLDNINRILDRVSLYLA